jgi:hypothetical protein
LTFKSFFNFQKLLSKTNKKRNLIESKVKDYNKEEEEEVLEVKYISGDIMHHACAHTLGMVLPRYQY